MLVVMCPLGCSAQSNRADCSRAITSGAGRIVAAVGQFLRVFEQVVEHRPEAGGVDVFPAAVEHHEQPALLDRLVQLQPDVLHAVIVFREDHLAPIRRHARRAASGASDRPSRM